MIQGEFTKEEVKQIKGLGKYEFDGVQDTVAQIAADATVQTTLKGAGGHEFYILSKKDVLTNDSTEGWRLLYSNNELFYLAKLDSMNSEIPLIRVANYNEINFIKGINK